MGPGLTKKGLPFQSDSLLGMALYDFDTLAADVGLHSSVNLPSRHNSHDAPPAFHPVDEYKDLSLKEILDLSDDFLSNDLLLGHCNNNGHNSEYSMELNLSNVPAAQFRAAASNLIGSLDLNSLNHQEQLLAFNLEQQHMFLQEQQSQLNQLQMQQMSQLQQPQSQQQQQQQQPALTSSGNFSPKKRSRDFSDEDSQFDESDDSSAAGSKERRFRPYQAGQWSEKFEELCNYKDEMGHCLVPHTFRENLALARWVKRQRYQYKLMVEGKSSTMTADRVKALDDIGFVWDSQGAAWGERLGELQQFRQTYMHCNVPSNFNDNPRLATWIKCQRRQYKLYMDGKASNMTLQRIQHLENLGFEWELRTYKKQRTN
jgi:hypothetical protein